MGRSLSNRLDSPWVLLLIVAISYPPLYYPSLCCSWLCYYYDSQLAPRNLRVLNKSSQPRFEKSCKLF
jgi:hypothetical protein